MDTSQPAIKGGPSRTKGGGGTDTLARPLACNHPIANSTLKFPEINKDNTLTFGIGYYGPASEIGINERVHNIPLFKIQHMTPFY
jgi:hypothetical protein